jgi:hypothetical protein
MKYLAATTGAFPPPGVKTLIWRSIDRSVTGSSHSFLAPRPA